MNQGPAPDTPKAAQMPEGTANPQAKSLGKSRHCPAE